MSCPDDKTLRLYLDARLDEEQNEQIDEHLEQCPTCSERVTQLERSRKSPLITGLKGIDLKNFTDDSDDDSDDDFDLPTEPVPETIGNYTIDGLLGSGGMGTVYRGVNPHLNRAAAVKVIKASRALRPSSAERFQRELLAIGKLRHPNIVEAFDAGVYENRPYLAMELLEGEDLSCHVKKYGPLPIKEACDIIRQAALGLQHAHEAGLVHRDIKPSNLFRTKDGTIKILDLGLARLLETESGEDNPNEKNTASAPDATAEGQILGSPDYMSPEQAVNARSVDVRGDLYSLGCTFFYLLTGTPPFGESTHPELEDKIKAHTDQDLPPLEIFRKDIPASIRSIIRKMTAKNPTDRFQTASEILDVLDTRRNTKHKKMFFYGMLIVAIVVLAVSVYIFRTIGTSKDFTEIAPVMEQEIVQKNSVSEPKMTVAEEEPDTPIEENELTPVVQPAEFVRTHPDDENWRLTRLLCVGDVRLNTAFITDKERGEFNTTYFTGDGKRIIDADSKDKGLIKIWDIETGKEIGKFNGPPSPVTTMTVSKDRSLLASGHEDGRVVLWDARSQRRLVGRKPNGIPVRSLCFSDDGKKLFTLWNSLEIVDTTTGKVLASKAVLKPTARDYRCGSAFGPDDDYVFFSTFGTLGLYSLSKNRSYGFNTEVCQNPIPTIRMSPDFQSMAIAYCGSGVWFYDNVKRLLDVFAYPHDVTKSRFRHSGSRVFCVCYSPDGTHLLTGGDHAEVRLQPLSGASGPTRTFPLKHEHDTVTSLDFSPVGMKFLIRTRYDSIIAVWEHASRTGQNETK